MNPSIPTRQSTFPVDTVIRVAVVAATIIAVFVIGYSAPVDRVLVQDARAAATDAGEPATYGNGPTGYFPDMFEQAARAAEPVAPIETF